jgi:CheY-like chemotaxis protein
MKRSFWQGQGRKWPEVKMKKRVMLIEDEQELVDLMKMRLEASGYETLAAYDGEEGLKIIEKNRPDLVLLDILMPKLDGFAVCRKLKAEEKTKNIPIVVVSASGGKDLPKRCLDAGADDFIFKPFEAKDLLEKVAKWLGKK